MQSSINQNTQNPIQIPMFYSEVNLSSNKAQYPVFNDRMSQTSSEMSSVQSLMNEKRFKQSGRIFHKVNRNQFQQSSQLEFLHTDKLIEQFEITSIPSFSQISQESKQSKIAVKSEISQKEQKIFDQNSIFIQNVNYNAKESYLMEYFQDCGKILKITILTKKKGKEKIPKGMAYITFADKQGADRAVKLSGGEFMKRNLTIQKKRNNKPGVTHKKKLTYLQYLQHKRDTFLMPTQLLVKIQEQNKKRAQIQKKKQLQRKKKEELKRMFFQRYNELIKKPKQKGK